jgi:hypothetical protein
MRRALVSQTGVGASAPIPVDFTGNPNGVSLSIIKTGTVTYTIQHTFDDIFSPTYNPSTGNWFDHDNAVLVNATANANDNVFFPITAVRINQTAGSGTTNLTVLEGLAS